MHNIMIYKTVDGSYEFCLIFQKLPILYRIEYVQFYSNLYEEEEYELNERLLLKKLAFLFYELSIEEESEHAPEKYSDLRNWNQHAFMDGLFA